MELEKYPNHCSQCGALLTRRENGLVCDYCGQEYSDSTKNSEPDDTEI